MRAVIQRVHSASVVVDGETIAQIDAGLLVYVGVAAKDIESDAAWLAEKVRYLRVFPDDGKPLNRDVAEAGGTVLAVSAFTTQADARKGRRPGLSYAAGPEEAEQLYESFCAALRSLGVSVQQGRFRAHMDVYSVNDGPICVLVDSTKLF
ncbi:MAG: D-tyrosyl-tRNA(Tyr) deacylase [Phycisphaerales bacterium]|nr:D-tyrosyl-tRNA(Tyr) deacylase [Phycisphaerales bacterium]